MSSKLASRPSIDPMADCGAVIYRVRLSRGDVDGRELGHGRVVSETRDTVCRTRRSRRSWTSAQARAPWRRNPSCGASAWGGRAQTYPRGLLSRGKATHRGRTWSTILRWLLSSHAHEIRVITKGAYLRIAIPGSRRGACWAGPSTWLRVPLADDGLGNARAQHVRRPVAPRAHPGRRRRSVSKDLLNCRARTVRGVRHQLPGSHGRRLSSTGRRFGSRRWWRSASPRNIRRGSRRARQEVSQRRTAGCWRRKVAPTLHARLLRVPREIRSGTVACTLSQPRPDCIARAHGVGRRRGGAHAARRRARRRVRRDVSETESAAERRRSSPGSRRSFGRLHHHRHFPWGANCL